MRISLFNPFGRTVLYGLALLSLMFMGITCHHSSSSGGHDQPFEYSEAQVLGLYMGVGISCAPDAPGGPECNTFLTTLNADGLGSFSTLEYTSNTNGTIASHDKSGLYEVDEDATLRFAWDGDLQSLREEGKVILYGEMMVLNRLEQGDDPGFQLLMEYDEPGSYDISQLTGEYWMYGYCFDMTEYPTAVVGRSLEMILTFNHDSGTFSWARNFWYNYNWDLNEHELIQYPAETKDYEVDENGWFTLYDLPNIPELRGVISKDRETAFLSAMTQDAEPLIYVMYRKGGVHAPANLTGEFYVLNHGFSFNNLLHSSSYAELEYDGANYFSGDFTSNYTQGIETGFMEGSYFVGGVGYTTMTFFATSRDLGGGLNAYNNFAALIAPGGDDNDRSPGLFLFIRKK